MCSNEGLFAVSAAGMAVQRLRVEVAARNLANVNTIQVGGDGGYRPMRVVVEEGGGFGRYLAGCGVGIPAARVVASEEPSRRVYEPRNPFADEKGFVVYPGVDAATEMVALMTATRAYEANVAAFNAGRMLVLKTLDIGGGA